MSKFEKKLLKSGVKFSNAIVIGTGFGYLVDILNIFKTVFVFDEVRPDLKFKNLVYRENYLDLGDFSDISMIFIDLSHLDKLSVLPPVMNRFQPPIAIEGNDVVELGHVASASSKSESGRPVLK